MGSPIKYVDHTYRDFSRYEQDGGELAKHKKSGKNFPARLHQILSEEKNSDAITWMPHGRAWKVLDKGRLVSEVIPNYYKCTQFESFTRQLNGWGFKRLHQAGPDFGCYYHECFLRDLPNLTCLIRRLQHNVGKSMPYAEGEPNFYRISQEYPLPPHSPRSFPRPPDPDSPNAWDSQESLSSQKSLVSSRKSPTQGTVQHLSSSLAMASLSRGASAPAPYEWHHKAQLLSSLMRGSSEPKTFPSLAEARDYYSFHPSNCAGYSHSYPPTYYPADIHPAEHRCPQDPYHRHVEPSTHGYGFSPGIRAPLLTNTAHLGLEHGLGVSPVKCISPPEVGPFRPFPFQARQEHISHGQVNARHHIEPFPFSWD